MSEYTAITTAFSTMRQTHMTRNIERGGIWFVKTKIELVILRESRSPVRNVTEFPGEKYQNTFYVNLIGFSIE